MSLCFLRFLCHAEATIHGLLVHARVRRVPWEVLTWINHSLVPAGNQKLYRSPFFRDFWHLNVAMMTSNNALVPDADKEDTIASKPFDWPFLYNGMRMNGWIDGGEKYYLLGNPITWWISSVSLGVWALTLLWHLMRFQRKINDFAPGEYLFLVLLAGFISRAGTDDSHRCYKKANGTTSCICQRSRSAAGRSTSVSRSVDSLRWRTRQSSAILILLLWLPVPFLIMVRCREYTESTDSSASMLTPSFTNRAA